MCWARRLGCWVGIGELEGGGVEVGKTFADQRGEGFFGGERVEVFDCGGDAVG